MVEGYEKNASWNGPSLFEGSQDMEMMLIDGAGTTPDPQDAVSPEPLTPPDPAPTLEQVLHEYAPRVFSMARRMVASETDAEDVTQDVLLQVIRKLDTFRGHAAFPTWLHRITVNAALSHRRKRAVREEHRIHGSLDALLEAQTEGPANRVFTPPPEVELQDQETRRLIEEAIACLPEMYRLVFVLSDIEGLPNADIADRVGMSLPAVKSRLHRARALLREALGPHLDEIRA
jgi:RNA polymerase sigma-70 factor (ECF subfamily)